MQYLQIRNQLKKIKRRITTKTREELKELKEEYETLNKKLKELTEDELKQISGGYVINCAYIGDNII